jgi:hypothetical protein
LRWLLVKILNILLLLVAIERLRFGSFSRENLKARL